MINSHPPLPTEQRVLAAAASLGLVFSLAIVIIGAGHGAGPVGLLLVLGDFSAWGWHLSLGWSGVLLTVAALFFSRRTIHFGLGAGGLLCLAASWVLFFMTTETRGFTLVTSLPFLGGASWRLIQLTSNGMRRRPNA